MQGVTPLQKTSCRQSYDAVEKVHNLAENCCRNSFETFWRPICENYGRWPLISCTDRTREGGRFVQKVIGISLYTDRECGVNKMFIICIYT